MMYATGKACSRTTETGKWFLSAAEGEYRVAVHYAGDIRRGESCAATRASSSLGKVCRPPSDSVPGSAGKRRAATGSAPATGAAPPLSLSVDNTLLSKGSVRCLAALS
jgi:hypothetical protein